MLAKGWWPKSNGTSRFVVGGEGEQRWVLRGRYIRHLRVNFLDDCLT